MAEPAVNRYVRTGGTRVLAVEDSEVSLRMLQVMLRPHGYAVDLARDGRSALAMVKSGRYDVVLMDIRMPEMTGIEATMAIRALDDDRAKVPIVGLSATFDDENSIREAEAAGMSACLAKPVSAHALTKAIEKILARPAA